MDFFFQEIESLWDTKAKKMKKRKIFSWPSVEEGLEILLRPFLPLNNGQIIVTPSFVQSHSLVSKKRIS